MNELEQVLPFGLNPEHLLMVMSAGMAFLTVVAVWFGLLERNPMERRVKMVTLRREELRGQALADGQSRRRRKDEGMSVVRQLVKSLRLLQSQQEAKLQERLAPAGMRSRDAMMVFVLCKLVMPILFGVAAFVLVYPMELGELPNAIRVLIVLGAVVFGFFSPELYVSNATSKRQLALGKGLPDALDLLVICAESGLALDAALERVANEIGGANGVLAEELMLTSVELGFLPDRRQALHNLNRRTNMSSIRGVVNTLLQTEKYGTPLSQSLRVLANEFRDQRMMRAEEKAARLPATLTVPMIVFILPTLFIVLIGPAILSVMDNLL
jgi:tight adherence protein C